MKASILTMKEMRLHRYIERQLPFNCVYERRRQAAGPGTDRFFEQQSDLYQIKLNKSFENLSQNLLFKKYLLVKKLLKEGLLF